MAQHAQSLADDLLRGQRRALAKAITLVENRRPDRRRQALELLQTALPHSGKSIRIGISGVPGVGKSTFIESFGLYLIEQGHHIATLAVDPSSTLSGGSILGDKVRMPELARHPNAFIRPSPSSGTLGGVARRTRESMLLCEAAGYDIILVETVGVGQSETAVADMVDFFLVLMLPNAGDEIQGIKKGIIEMADLLVINKADGPYIKTAKEAKRQYSTALHFLRPRRKGWHTKVQIASAKEGSGIAEIWETIQKQREFLMQDQRLETLRFQQNQTWFRQALIDGLEERLFADPSVKEYVVACNQAMAANQKTAYQCADEILEHFFNNTAQ